MILLPQAPVGISQQGLYSYIGNAVFNTPEWSIPERILNEELPTKHQIDIEEYANRVVHPVTQETITRYKVLIKDPLLKDKWMKATWVELCILTQGYQDIPVTNPIQFITHEEI